MHIQITNRGGNHEDNSHFIETWEYNTEEEKGQVKTIGQANSKYGTQTPDGEKKATQNVEELESEQFIQKLLEVIAKQS